MSLSDRRVGLSRRSLPSPARFDAKTRIAVTATLALPLDVALRCTEGHERSLSSRVIDPHPIKGSSRR